MKYMVIWMIWMNFRTSREGKEREDSSRTRPTCRCSPKPRRVGRGKE